MPSFDSFIFTKEALRPTTLVTLKKFPELMRIGDIVIDGEQFPALIPTLWKESLSLSYQINATTEATQIIEDWCAQLIAQAWGKLRFWAWNTNLNASFTALEAIAQTADLADRKGQITFIRTRQELESNIVFWKNLASERKSRLAMEAPKSWLEIVNDDDANDFCLIVLCEADKLYESRFQSDILELISHGPQYGLIFWSLISQSTQKSISRYELDQRNNWISGLQNSSLCSFRLIKNLIEICGDAAKMQPFSTYTELGGVTSSPLSPTENLALRQIISDNVAVEKITQKSNFLELIVGSKNGQPFLLRFGAGSEVYHGMLAGATGKGKTLFLKNLLVSACEKYSPNQIQFHVFDFKDGIDFAVFEDVAHVAHLHSQCHDPQSIISALSEFVDEAKYRNEIFKQAQKEGYSGGDLFNYNEWAISVGREQIPFRMLVIDEVARLFMLVRHDHEQQKKLIELLTTVAIVGRSPGLSLLLASQSFSDLPTSVDGLKSHMQLRMSLQVDRSSDCYGLFASGNTAAFNQIRSNPKIREILINSDAGRLQGNEIVRLQSMDHSTILPRITAVKSRWQNFKNEKISNQNKIITNSVSDGELIKPDLIKDNKNQLKNAELPKTLTNWLPTDPLPEYPPK